MRRCNDLSKDQGRLLPIRFCSGRIIATRGYDFQEGQVRNECSKLTQATVCDHTRSRSEWLILLLGTTVSARYEEIAGEDVHGWLLDLLPATPATILESGREAVVMPLG